MTTLAKLLAPTDIHLLMFLHILSIEQILQEQQHLKIAPLSEISEGKPKYNCHFQCSVHNLYKYEVSVQILVYQGLQTYETSAAAADINQRESSPCSRIWRKQQSGVKYGCWSARSLRCVMHVVSGAPRYMCSVIKRKAASHLDWHSDVVCSGQYWVLLYRALTSLVLNENNFHQFSLSSLSLSDYYILFTLWLL